MSQAGRRKEVDSAMVRVKEAVVVAAKVGMDIVEAAVVAAAEPTVVGWMAAGEDSRSTRSKPRTQQIRT